MIQQKVACKALIVNQHNEILILQKGNDNARHAGKSGRYNLPGGKIDAGELLHDGLRREVYEETSLELINIDAQPMFAGEWRPTVNGNPLQIIGLFYVCRTWHGDITLNDEHSSFVWVGAHDFGNYAILPPEDEAIRNYFTKAKNAQN